MELDEPYFLVGYPSVDKLLARDQIICQILGVAARPNPTNWVVSDWVPCILMRLTSIFADAPYSYFINQCQISPDNPPT